MEKWTYKTTADAIMSVVNSAKAQRADVALDITPSEDGGFDRHYGNFVSSTPAVIMAFITSVVAQMNTGNYTVRDNYQASWVAHTLKNTVGTLKSNKLGDIRAFLSATEGNAKNTNLHRYLQAIGNSMKNVKNNPENGGDTAYTPAKSKPRAPKAKTTGIDMGALEQLAALLNALK